MKWNSELGCAAEKRNQSCKVGLIVRLAVRLVGSTTATKLTFPEKVPSEKVLVAEEVNV